MCCLLSKCDSSLLLKNSICKANILTLKHLSDSNQLFFNIINLFAVIVMMFGLAKHLYDFNDDGLHTWEAEHSSLIYCVFAVMNSSLFSAPSFTEYLECTTYTELLHSASPFEIGINSP